MSNLLVVKNEGPDFYVDVEQVPTPKPGMLIGCVSEPRTPPNELGKILF